MVYKTFPVGHQHYGKSARLIKRIWHSLPNVGDWYTKETFLKYKWRMLTDRYDYFAEFGYNHPCLVCRFRHQPGNDCLECCS